MQYVLLRKEDKDIPVLQELHNLPAIKKYISISENYFKYVTSAENVWYYKIMQENTLIGAVHLEKYDEVLYLSIWIRPEFQRKGYACVALADIENNLNHGAQFIQVSIDDDNISSLRLFEKAGYVLVGVDEELRDYKKNLMHCV